MFPQDEVSFLQAFLRTALAHKTFVQKEPS